MFATVVRSSRPPHALELQCPWPPPPGSRTIRSLCRSAGLTRWAPRSSRYTPPPPFPAQTPPVFRQMHRDRPQRALPAWFVRGGTSNGLVMHRDDLPPEHEWSRILPAAMGSPDPYGRQLDGMGSGISSTSKIVVLGAPSRPDVDVDYTFVQVGIKDGSLDMAGNCGNMSSMVGPVAWDKGLVLKPDVDLDHDDNRWATVRFFNTNTKKVMASRFKISGSSNTYCPIGEYEMDGVPGKGSKITMSFLDPAGAKTGKALPTDKPIDLLRLEDGSVVEASLVDVGNPGVFVSAKSLNFKLPGITNTGRNQGANRDSLEDLTPAIVEEDAALKSRLEQIRRAGAKAMGLDPDVQSIPKIVLLHPSSEGDGVDIRCLAMSMGQAHKAVPLTLALCLGAASQIEGTIASSMLHDEAKNVTTIGHPSGKVAIGATLTDGRITSAQILRTGRVLMKGEVYY